MRLLTTAKNKLKFLSKLNDLFDRKEKIRFSEVIIATIVMALFQAIGIVSILPFINIVMDINIIHENKLLSYLYNSLGFTNANSFIFFSGIAVLCLIIISNIISAFATWLEISFICGKKHRLSTALLQKYLFSPYAYFLNQNTADLGKNVLSEVENLTDGFLLSLLRLITRITVTAIIFAILIYINAMVALAAAAILIFLYLTIYFRFYEKLKTGGSERIEEHKQRFKLAGEALGGIKDVKILGKEDYFLQEFSKHSKKFSDLQSWYQTVSQVPRYIMEIIAFGSVIGFILFLISSEYSGKEIIPFVGLFTFAGYRLMPALQEIFHSFISIRFNKAVLDKIHEDMTKNELNKTDKFIKNGLLKPISFKETLQLKNVSFSYPGKNELILKDVNLEIKKNTFIAIVGQTGSGKTTIIDIIMGILTVNNGTIIVDNIEINEKNVKNWQANLGYVPQHIYLLDDTIARNIAFGLPNEKIDMNKVKYAAKIANMDNFIENELVNGYETNIGERGIKLSGGEKQRIGIARALYHDPEILIFDEATNSLDGTTEKAVLEAIESISKLKTMIVVAHRLTTVKNCDLIYLMHKGKIEDRGNYDDLIKNNARFRAMAEKMK